MGTLKPGATYIYENDGRRVYAREQGSLTRQLVGEMVPNQQHRDDDLWKQIRIAADSNPTLRDALDRVLMIYRLNQDNG